MSIEALAMAGMDYAESGIRIEEWEDEGVEEKPPLYLIADHHHHHHLCSIEEDQEDKRKREINYMANKKLKARMRKWAKAVASMNNNILYISPPTNV